MRTIVAALALIGVTALPAAAAEFTLDTSHTQAKFQIRHLAISTVEGRIPVTSGTITTGAGDVPTAMSATLDVRGINTEDAKRDADLRSADWFDAEKHPTMTFVSKRIEPGQNGTFTATGELTFHGVTKPVTLAGKMEGRVSDGRGRTHVGYSATGTIDRRTWGLNTLVGNPGGTIIVGTDVTIVVNAEAVAK